MVKILVSKTKVAKINTLLETQWNDCEYATLTTRGLEKADMTKHEACSDILKLESSHASMQCPFYLRDLHFCMQTYKFILAPTKTTCHYHPRKAQGRFYKAIDDVRKMKAQFAEEKQKDKDIADAFISDLKDIMHYFMEIAPLDDLHAGYKKEALQNCLSFFAELSSFVKI
jgi:hypothetical protein